MLHTMKCSHVQRLRELVELFFQCCHQGRFKRFYGFVRVRILNHVADNCPVVQFSGDLL